MSRTVVGMMELSDFVTAFIVLSLIIYSTVAAEVNLALKKPAYSYDVASEGVPSKAVDNDDSGGVAFIGGSCMKTNAHQNSWFAVDLEKTQHVRRVLVINRSDQNDQFLTNFDIVVSDIKPPGMPDGTSNGPLTRLSDLLKDENICLTRTTVIPKEGSTTLTCTKTKYFEGQYVYLILKGADPLNMCEFSVYGGFEGNLALNKPAYSYDVASGGVPSRAVDNDDSNGGVFFGGSCMKTDPHTNSWFAVDLGKTQRPVQKVTVVNRSDKDHQFLTNFDIVVSDIKPPGMPDGTSNGPLTRLSDLLKDENICLTRTTVIPKEGSTTLTCTKTKYFEGQYVYLILKGADPLNMCEFSVYGGFEGNLALNKPAYSYDVASGGVPSRAVDNDDSNGGVFFGGSCMKTDPHTNSWFAVDLGKTQRPVQKVTVVNRSDKDHAFLTNFDIVVSDIKPPGTPDGNANSRLMQLSNLMKSENICLTRTTVIPRVGVNTLTCTKFVEGRYVYLILQGNTILSMCEFGVYGGDPTTTTAASTSSTEDGVSLCPAETHGGIPWSATLIGGSDSQRCMVGYIGMASRKCSKNANVYGWERPSLVHCVSHEMQDVYLESVDLARGNNTTTVEASSARLRKVTGGKTKLVSGELFKSVSIIENFVTAEEIRGSGTDLTEQNIVESASNILDLKYKSSWLDVQELYAGTALLMKQVDRYGRVVSGRHVQNKWRVLLSKNIVLQTKKAKATEMNLDAKIKRVVFPDSGLADMPTWVNKELTQLSVDVKAIYGDAEVGLCGLQYKTLNALLPVDISENTASISTVNSDVLALSITSERNIGRFDPPIRLQFKHVEKNFTNATCNFWDFNANKTAEMRKNVGAWSTAGCKLVRAESHNGYTTCECDHLTNFAILMSPSKTKTSVELKYMTLIGCGISLACLVVTVIIYAIYWKKLNSERSVILLNLCVSLILALVTFLAGVDRKENKHVCTAIAAMLHFFFLAVFSFMLMEGIELYIMLVKVFAFGGGRKKWYILGGWGLPAVVVGISLGATQAKGYGNEDYCWLSLDNGLLWAFVVPALIIILINCVFLGMAMKAMLTRKSMEAKSKQNKAKHGVRGLCILMPLLGTTWVFGVLAVNNSTIAFQYIFTICNSLQGLFIFIFHCLMNQHLLKLWKVKRGRRASSSGSSNTKPIKPRIKQNNNTKKPRKASLSTDDMTLGWESDGSESKPADPNLGVMNNRAFDDSDLNDSITHQTKPVDHNSIDFSVSH